MCKQQRVDDEQGQQEGPWCCGQQHDGDDAADVSQRDDASDDADGTSNGPNGTGDGHDAAWTR